MKSLIIRLLAIAGLTAAAWAASAAPGTSPESSSPGSGLFIREVRYEGKLNDQEARFSVDLTAESTDAGELALPLFEGELALLPPRLPSAVRVERSGDQYRLVISRRGFYQLKFELLAKVARAELWNQVSFLGPAAAIASLSAQAAGNEVHLLNGTVLESGSTNGAARLRGFLGAEPTVALRWSQTGDPAQVSRKTLVTVDTTATALVTPTVVKHVTELHYEILQGKLARLTIGLPRTHALTRLVGEQIRDWEVKGAAEAGPGDLPSPTPTPAAGAGSAGQPVLTVEFIKPLERDCRLILYSEQTIDAMPSSTALAPPQPLEAERESGTFIISTEDTIAEIDSAPGLRQVNAPTNALAAYRFNGRPLSLNLNLKRIEPVLKVAERVSPRLEETRLVLNHVLTLEVEKAGVYSVDLQPQAGFLVSEVRGDGVDDWKLSAVPNSTNPVLHVSFSSRVLGSRRLDVQLEQSLKNFPDRIVIGPLRVAGAARETAQIGAAASPGIRLKTSELVGLREIPINQLPNRADALLAYTAEQADWQLGLAAERLAARVVADVFNLVTIGDGIVGGSATIRYSLINQGVQDFEVTVPASWRNVDFTGPNIRRKEQRPDGLWVIRLQDKAWGGYTLVVTYDFQFDPKGAALSLGGIHTRGVERETGSVAITTAASLQLKANAATAGLQRVDEAELAPADRALITRSVLLAYQYSGSAYNLAVDTTRFKELPVVSAVADRTQLTTVLTEAGEMLTQGSFMVKNNDKQFQRFRLPPSANFWSCDVNGRPVKAERDGEWLLVPLPRGANCDQAFAVDIVYAEKKGFATSLAPHTFRLTAPQTDVPNTYAEWQLYAPAAFRLSAFAGNMTVARGTTYDLRDACTKFTTFYDDVLREAGPGLFLGATFALLMVAVIGAAVRRGWSGVLAVLGVFCILALLGGMMLPALARAKARAQRISATNNLKQIGLAIKTFSLDNGDRLPASLEEMASELGTDKVLIDPESGQRFVYVGAGHSDSTIRPDSILAFSPSEANGYRTVLLADGSVQQVKADKFAEMTARGYILPATAEDIAQNQQAAAVRAQQLPQSSPGVVGANPFNPQPATQANPAPAALPAASGARSLHIEIPRTGELFTFTKVLNVGDEPLSVQANLMCLQTFQMAQMGLQLSGFLTGLLLCWWQWRCARRNSLILTAALALALVSVGNLLLAWRILHLAFIWAAPLLALAMVAWVAWKFWPRRAPETDAGHAALPASVPPAVAALTLLVLAVGSSATLAQSPARAEAVRSAAKTLVADSTPRDSLPAVSILNAAYAGTINEKVAQLEATFQVTASRAPQILPIFGEDVVVQEFSAKPDDAKLLREGGAVSVLVKRRGDITLRLKFLVRPGGDVTKRHVTFGIPAALTSRAVMTIDQPEADVDFPSAIFFKRDPLAQQTRVEALLGSGSKVVLSWTPRVKRAAEIAANVICHNASLVTFAGGALSARTILDYQVTQGELKQLRVRLPAGHKLLRVEGDSIRTWETQADGAGHLLVVDLLKGIAPSYKLTLETESLLDRLPATVKTQVPHGLEVKRETGVIGLRSEEELELVVERAEDLSRIDAEEFARSTGQKVEGISHVFRFLKPEFTLEAHLAAQQPQIEALVRNHVRVGQDQVNISADITYTIKRAGVFSLKALLPADYRVETVTGTNILQWSERTEGGQRLLEVALKERTTGVYLLKVELVQHLKELPKVLAIAGVQPAGAQKLAGFLAASADAGVAIQPSVIEGLTEIPATALGADDLALAGNVLAYKYLGDASQGAGTWKLSVATEAVESWVRAEIINTLTITETLVSGRALARYEIQNSPVKELRLKVPTAFRNVEIAGANIRRRDQTGEIWRVEFQNKIRGAHVLTVTWDQPRDSRTNRLDLQGVSAFGVERETGVLSIVAKPPLQVTEQAAADLKSIDTRDLPEWAGRPEEATVLAYRYLRPAYALTVDAKRFEEAEVLQALVEKLSLTTVVADDGQMMTEMSLLVRNHSRQYLEVTLPSGATVWSAFVAGQAVRPSVREGKLLLPLERSIGEDAPLAVELTYVGAKAFPQTRGAVDLLSPTLDLPFKGARWEVFLPPDHRYGDFSGTMSREVNAVAEAASFSVLDYSHKESSSKAELIKELKSELASAQRKLSSGQVKEAMVDYNRARAKGNFADNQDKDAQQLEQQLRRAQGSNLIMAQNAFSVNNNGQPADSQQQLAAANPRLQSQYDASTAEAQWAKLQQAQELGVAKVEPIRVNLPTRGLRHSFTQVLQTEVGKPMSIRLVATNDKAIHWPTRVTAATTSFLVLWILVAALTRHAPHRRDQAA